MKTKLSITFLSAAFLMTALAPALAMELKGAATTTPPPKMKKVDGACMAAAVEKRDSAMISSVDAYASSVKTALTTRKDALKAAWGVSDPKERRTALKTAWDAFRGTWRKAAKVLHDARKAAWKQFDTDRKACHGSPSDEPGSEGVDAQI